MGRSLRLIKQWATVWESWGSKPKAAKASGVGSFRWMISTLESLNFTVRHLEWRLKSAPRTSPIAKRARWCDGIVGDNELPVIETLVQLLPTISTEEFTESSSMMGWCWELLILFSAVPADLRSQSLYQVPFLKAKAKKKRDKSFKKNQVSARKNSSGC